MEDETLKAIKEYNDALVLLGEALCRHLSKQIEQNQKVALTLKEIITKIKNYDLTR